MTSKVLRSAAAVLALAASSGRVPARAQDASAPVTLEPSPSTPASEPTTPSAAIDSEAVSATTSETKASGAPEPPDPMLARYFDAMARSRLLAAETGSADELRELVARGEAHYLDGRDADALLPLVEAVDSPRFADFSHVDAALAGEHMLAQALMRLGSLRTARRYLERAIERGKTSPYFAPAVRSYVDAALSLGDAEHAADWLEPRVADASPDARSELAYLRGRARYEAGVLDAASTELERVGPYNRFYGSAQYLIGAIAARGRKLTEAERRFCKVAQAGTGSRYAFFVDQRFFGVQDMARLGLGRVAHEGLRGDDAFYYYFQVPQDSPRLPEAMFEAAYASYEGGEPETAIDLLDQLEARFPQASFSDEAAILRGYVALAKCDFDRADRAFERFVNRYARVLAETRRLLSDPVRRRGLYATLLAAREGKSDAHAVRRELLALLHVDPELERLHGEIERLDAESARNGRLSAELAALSERLRNDQPKAAAKTDPPDADELAALGNDLDAGFDAARALGEELDTLRAAGVADSKLRAHEKELAALSQRLEEVAATLRQERERRLASDALELPAERTELPELIASDAQHAARLPLRVQVMRAQLLQTADTLTLAALRSLETRLSAWVGQARIGRIDAVMGSKRRIERQIESLAAGRVPAELRDPLRQRGLLADDEEYWPFEGEDWPDEHEERYPVPKRKVQTK